MAPGFNLILESGLVTYGLNLFILRRVAAQKITGPQALIEVHGEITGYKIHLIGHTVLPRVARVLLIIKLIFAPAVSPCTGSLHLRLIAAGTTPHRTGSP
jgi:hypothetical protein